MARADRLFWDVDPRTLDPAKHEDFIVSRVLTEGDWTTVQAIRREMGETALREFVRRAGRRLDKRTRRFFETVLGIPPAPCETTSSTRDKEPLYRP